MRRRSIVFVLSGPSGAGKTTLAERLVTSVEGLVRSVSATTRAPRVGEATGVDYEFLSRDEFEAQREAGMFVEWAEVFGELYGTSRTRIDAMLNAGSDVLLSIDVQGAQQVREHLPDAVDVFLLPPSMEELERRLRQRSTESADEVARRLKIAHDELRCATRYDYIVVNDDLGTALKKMQSVIDAERGRSTRLIVEDGDVIYAARGLDRRDG